MAFSNDFLLRKSEGRRRSSIASTVRRPAARATSVRSSVTAGGLALPSGAKPIASLMEAIVLAVNMPPQAPAPGQAWRSISSSSSSLIWPVATAPHASNTFWIVTSCPRWWPGMMDPP